MTPASLRQPQTDRAVVDHNPAAAVLRRARHALLLQGPVGPFFDRLARWLRAGGTQVSRIVLHGGDEGDCQAVPPVRFRGAPAHWPAFLERFLRAHTPDVLVLFGQSRRYHQAAIGLARRRGLEVVVLEEGYWRPGFVTMELDGVNGASRTLERFSAGTQFPPVVRDDNGWSFQQMAWYASLHYLRLGWQGARYPAYEHHRSARPGVHLRHWLHTWALKPVRWVRDRRAQAALLCKPPGYFLVPLQHEGDAQLVHHSPFGGNRAFLERVIDSFARHAPADTRLVVRQHPHGRAGNRHASLVRELAARHGIGPRVQFLQEADTTALVAHARGVVVVNSTVGLLAIERGVPVQVLGEAVYRYAGVTDLGSLESFWQRPWQAPAAERARFLQELRQLTQMPCSLYAPCSTPLNWN